MFDFLKPGKGYAMTLDNKTRIEVDFGPMSNSEKKNSSQRECDHSPASRNAEIRVYVPGDGSKPSLVRNNATVEDFFDIIKQAGTNYA